MTDPNTDVTPSDSSPDTDPTQPDVSAAAVSAVDDQDVMLGDRPLKNVIAELDRKNAQRIEALKAEMLSALARPAAPAPTSREYTDEELAQLAAAGDARALQSLTDRQAARHAAQQTSALSQRQTEMQSLNALLARYPVLRDDTHPLTAYAAQVKLALLRGGQAESVATVIESIKTAIADNPDLAAQSAVRTTAPSAAPRPNVPTAHAAAPSARRAPSPAAKAVTISDAQWTLAKRYGYKTREDAAKALSNFERRQESGASRLGAVASFVREDA